MQTFEVWVSEDDVTYTKVLEPPLATIPNDGTHPTVLFPGGPVSDVSYVKYVPLTNYGHSSQILTRFFDVLATDVGGVAGFSTDNATGRVELAFDDSTTTSWTTQGATNEFVDMQLSRTVSHLIYGVTVRPNGATSPQDIEVWTSQDGQSYDLELSHTLPPGTTSQHELRFDEPVTASHVRFLWKTGYGSTISVRELGVLQVPLSGSILLSASSGTNTAEDAIDSFDSTTWTTTGNANEELLLLLPRARSWLIDRVALLSPNLSNTAPRQFEVQASTTTSEATEFTTVYRGTYRMNQQIQTFFFPAVRARYLKLLILDNYGASNIQLSTFYAVSPEVGFLPARFIDRSSDIDDPIVGHSWTFGDGGASTDQDPAHLYTAGEYPVTLTATSSTGGQDTVAGTYLALGEPVPAFSYTPDPAGEGDFPAFTDTTYEPGGIVTRFWDWADGTFHMTTFPTVQHNFPDDGVYLVTMTVTNVWGIEGSVTQPVTIYNEPPKIGSIQVPSTWVAEEPILTPPRINDPGRDDTWTCLWDFGDGSGPITGCDPQHAFPPAGPTDPPTTYTVTLTVTDDDGATSTATATPLVYPQIFEPLRVSTNGGISGVDWSHLVEKAVVGTQNPSRLFLVGVDGSDSGPITPSFGGDEPKIAVSPGLGGFELGDVYSSNGKNDELVRIKMDGNGVVTQIDNPWLVIPGAGKIRGGITFDDTGVFGYELIVVGTNGRVFRVKPDGTYSMIVDGPPFEGADVVPPGGFGLPNGGIVTVDLSGGNVHVIEPDGTTRPVIRLRAGGILEWAQFVASPGDYFVAAFLGQTRVILHANSTAIDGSFTGHVLVNTEHVNSGNPSADMWDVWYDDATGTYQSRRFTYGVADGQKLILEQSSFVSAVSSPNSLLEPATANLPVGATHTVTATIADAEGNPVPNLELTFTVTGANPSSGTATTDSTGVATFSYVGTTSGADQIVASSFQAQTNTVTAVWGANGPPVADDQTVTTDEDTPVAITLTASDPDGDPLTFSIVTGPSNGTLSGTAPDVVYDPTPGYVGADSFTFQVSDGQETSNVATVSITINDVNDPPVADDQSVSTDEDTDLAITLTATDPDGDPLTYTVVSGPTNGSLSGTPPTLTYSPTQDWNGTDSFTFKANDGQADSNLATVTITVNPVNDAPVADDQAVVTSEDTALPITLTASDADGDPLTFAIVAGPANGTLSGAPPSLVYTPAPDFYGADAFTFTASDGQATSNVATVSITVTAVNDPPVAADRQVTTDEDVAVAITLTGSDPDGDPLTFILASLPASGTLSGTPPDLSYAPNPDFNGGDTFTFTVEDGQTTSAVATVTITVNPVNDPPVADDQAVVGVEDTALPITLTASDIDGDPLTFAIVAGPANGTLSGAPPSLVYTPAPDFYGADAFTFTASDGQATSNVATVSITVTAVNDPPVAADQQVMTDEDVPVPITLTATDVEGDPLTFSVLSQPSNGSLSGSAPDLVYTPAPDYFGVDSFTFQADDGQSTSNVATVSITVNPVNDPPVADDQAVTTDEDTPVAIVLTAADPDGDPLTYTVVAGPTFGVLSGSPPSLTYTPDPDYFGPDSLTFKADDGQLESNVATVSITVRPVNDPPDCSGAFLSQTQLWPPNHKMVGISASGVTDPEGGTVSISTVSVYQDEPVQGPAAGTRAPTPAWIHSSCGLNVKEAATGASITSPSKPPTIRGQRARRR